MNTLPPIQSGCLPELVRIPSVQFTHANSADNNRVFLWENCDEPPFVRAVHGWKIIGYGKAPWAKADNYFAVMFEKQIPKGGYPTIKGEEMDEGDRIWQHFNERWLREMGNANDSSSATSGASCSGLGDRLRFIREKRGMTQLDLAKRTGLKPTAISHFETESRRPCLANLILLCRHLRVSADYLLDL